MNDELRNAYAQLAISAHKNLRAMVALQAVQAVLMCVLILVLK